MRYKLPALFLILFLIFALVPAAFADDGEEEEINSFCMDVESLRHPVGSSIAERYGLDYAKLMQWFCVDHFGFGEIMLAIETSRILGEDEGMAPEDVLALKTEEFGWGQVWKSLGFTGRPKGDDWAGGPPDWVKTKDKDKDAEEDGDLGPPEWAGPKDKDRKKPLPATAGPKDKVPKP